MDDLEFYETIKNNYIFIQKDSEGLIVLEKLNKLIHGGKQTQQYTVCILNIILQKCSDKILEENAVTWMRYFVQILNTSPSDNVLRSCYLALTSLLQHACLMDKVARDVATKGIDALLSLLVGSSLPLSADRLNLLRCCLKTFPGPCGQQKNNLYKLAVAAIDSELSATDLVAAFKLYALLPRCGSPGEKEKKYADNWLNQFNQIVNTCQYYLSNLNDKLSRKMGDMTMDETLKFISFPEITNKSEMDTYKLLDKIEKVLLMLKYFISSALSWEVHFPVLKLVNLFCDLSNLLQFNSKEQKMVLVGRKITEALLQCLCVTIKQFRTLILNVMQPLARILTSLISNDSLLSRSGLYQCALHLFINLKIAPKNVSIIDDLLPCIIKDIKINEDSSFLISEGQNTDGIKSGQSTRKHPKLGEVAKTNLKRLDYDAHENTYAALKVLEKIIQLNGSLLSSNNLRLIISNVFKVFAKLYTQEEFPPPYICDNNRLILYKVSKGLLFLQHGSVHLPVTSLLSYFKVGVKESQSSIHNYCHHVLLDYDTVFHPLNRNFYDNKKSVECDDDSDDFSQSPPTLNKDYFNLTSSDQSFSKSVLNQELTSRMESDSTEQQVDDIVESAYIESKSLKTVIPHKNTTDSNDQGVPIVVYSKDDCDEEEHDVEDDDEEDNKTIEEEEENGTVVISDNSSEEDVSCVPRKYEAAPQKHSVRKGPSDIVENMYSPTCKKPKLNNNGIEEITSCNGDTVLGEGDEEYIKILDTFCEFDADN